MENKIESLVILDDKTNGCGIRLVYKKENLLCPQIRRILEQSTSIQIEIETAGTDKGQPYEILVTIFLDETEPDNPLWADEPYFVIRHYTPNLSPRKHDLILCMSEETTGAIIGTLLLQIIDDPRLINLDYDDYAKVFHKSDMVWLGGIINEPSLLHLKQESEKQFSLINVKSNIALVNCDTPGVAETNELCEFLTSFQGEPFVGIKYEENKFSCVFLCGQTL